MIQSQLHAVPLQLWGGIECTVNRIGDQYHDQLIKSGHATRISDVERIAQLGFTALRYPVLWERTAPNDIVHADWTWADERLNKLEQLGISPIVGLVHHGSGPRWTSLLEESFVTGLADYAEAVASRYPWVETYTPVNEPLTTARFSGLYGHWFPHAQSDEAFITALIVQCRAASESMRRIRAVNPSAKLLFTEDLAKTHSTPMLADQARFENQRRWLSIDLLMGRVDPQHELWWYVARTPQLKKWLYDFLDNPLIPDILGFNYYLTSERFLDERIDNYPAWSHGGNGLHRYADVDAVRVRAEGMDGAKNLLLEAWQRYHLPMAITEVHLCGNPSDQIRWVHNSWLDAHALRECGVDVQAMTLWSLFGCYDWNSLCTCIKNHYEPGVFDVRTGQPQATELARFVAELAQGKTDVWPSVPELGWWQTDQRLVYPPVATTDDQLLVETF